VSCPQSLEGAIVSSGDLAGILPLVLIVLAFWFLVIRPARKRQQDMTRTQNSVETGSQVMLGSGIFGTVVAVADDSVQLEIAPGTTVKVARQAVVRVIEEPVATEPVEERRTEITDEQD
jgi:preprotein translocase subunit YajC